MNANEARIAAENNELNSLRLAISEAIQAGDTEIKRTKISDINRKKIEDDGYKVEWVKEQEYNFGAKYESDVLKISW